MSETKFTEGDWRVVCYGAVFDSSLSRCNFDFTIECHGRRSYTDEASYNAKLIESAPDLYGFIENHMSGHPEADALLAKARGESRPTATEVWEVYKENSQDCVIFRTEFLARSQSIVFPVDVVAPAVVNLTEEELIELKTKGYLL